MTRTTHRPPGIFWAGIDAQSQSSYHRWRADKLARVSRCIGKPPVEITNPAQLEPAALAALGEQVQGMNFAFYRITGNDSAAFDHHALQHLCNQLGLRRLAANPFAEASGISEIRVAANNDSNDQRRDYIPYTNRALNWHTDGYYNPPQRRISAFAMHTVRAAARGGENRFLDHELLYLLLRDRDPALAACLFDADVLTIPPGLEAAEAGTKTRGLARGPALCHAGGRLHLRFTLRKRNIRWKPTPAVRAALTEIDRILHDPGNQFVVTRRFAPGEGVVGNNVLHDRAAFVDGADGGRLVLRARFYDSVEAGSG